MKLEYLTPSAEWEAPIFKILAKSDTGEGRGHQSGILIPKSIRHYFPQLQGTTSPSRPTLDKRIKAALYHEERFLSTVATRYQYQSWHDTRAHEARLTDQLGLIHGIAQAGDILVMQRSSQADDHFKLTLVPKTSQNFRFVRTLIGTRRWGILPIT